MSRYPRTYVCQGCGAVHTILHGDGVACECGTISGAELLPPVQAPQDLPHQAQMQLLQEDVRALQKAMDAAIMRAFIGG